MARTKTKAAVLVLRQPANGLANLTVEYRDVHDKFKRINTRIKVIPKYWDASTNTIRANGSSNPVADTKTAREKLAEVNAIIAELERKLKRMPAVTELSDALEAAEAPKADTTLLLPTLLEWMNTPRIQPWADNTRKSFKTLYNNLEAYQTATRTVLRFDTFTKQVIIDFQHWLLKTYDYKNSVLVKRVGLLRQFLQEVSDSHSVKVAINHIKPLYGNKTTRPFTLSVAEIEALRTLETGSKKLERIQDLMTLQIFTGFRHSDLIRISRKDVNYMEEVITIRQQKTGDKLTIPLFPYAALVLQKYTDTETGEINLPKYSLQKFNDYLKELAALVPELKEKKYTKESLRGKTSTKDEVSRCEMVRSHVLRYSFVTMCLNLGYTETETRQMSGHKTMAAFQRYVGITAVAPKAANRFTDAYSKALQ
ncbi:tyrosine-type recombinase/integrase [Hymenobacter sp. BT18]|uniref:tyrosine-type recombinase/integrase n=1 Tax=Hymenobacter sp. BT18 TaxID=2835648 RepID=UPI00143E24D2|nr:tyrosine-type recombinase/integrase [Hymenobacter sp. BT18]QIX62873.1 tyrosine-type recombinase/integrase [Hymenobacter sp. BT18]